MLQLEKVTGHIPVKKGGGNSVLVLYLIHDACSTDFKYLIHAIFL